MRDNNKVLIIQHSGAIGGSGLSLIHIVESLLDLKYEVELVLPSYMDDLANVLVDYPCRILRAEVPYIEFYNGGLNSLFSPYAVLDYFRIAKAKREFRKIISNSEAQTVMVNSMTLCWLGKIIQATGKRAICFHRETYQKSILGFRKSIITKRLKRDFDDVVFISNFDAKETGKINGRKHIILDRVDNSIENLPEKKQAKERLGLDENKQYILFLGGISELKGTHIAIEAMGRLLDTNIELMVLGVNSPLHYIGVKDLGIKGIIRCLFQGKIYDNYFLKVLKKSKCNDVVHFIKSTVALSDYYASCEALIVTNTLPHQSRMIYEAGIARIPIIIPAYKNTKEFLRDGENGYEYEPNNSISLAEKIRQVLADDNCQKNERMVEMNYEMAAKNHGRASLNYDVERLMKTTE